MSATCETRVDDTSVVCRCFVGDKAAIGTLSTDDGDGNGDGNGDVGTERKDWGENAVVARILNIKHLPNLQR